MMPDDASMTTTAGEIDADRLLAGAEPVSGDNRDRLLAGTPPIFRAAAGLVERMEWGSVVARLPNGRVLRFTGRERPDHVGVIDVKDYRFARRTLFGGSAGFFEAYLDDQWDSPDIAAFLQIFAANADAVQKVFLGNAFMQALNRFAHWMNRNSRAGSRRNIMAHYDLGNAFYAEWLDETMTYSSALFETGTEDLATAQINKYRALARRMGLRGGESVLEIGSGWGGFAEFAAKEVGARVTGVTISPEQYEFAKARMQREGLAEKVDIRLQDYRDVEGRFDRIASIEMFEAVGEKYWPQYFGQLRERLKPGGVAGLQIITIADRFFENYRAAPDFIQKYVFPGGMLPSPSRLEEELRKAGLSIAENVGFGESYADTLRAWRERFTERLDAIRPMGFDNQFEKLWRFYLAYCEAGFRAGTTDVVQVAAVKA